MRFLAVFALTIGHALAQSAWHDHISAGFKAGSPLNDPSVHKDAGGTYRQSRWTGGPTVEVHLPWNFAVEFDALYRTSHINRLDIFRFGPNVNPYLRQSSQSVDSWDLPLLLKYRFSMRALRPFVSAGYLFTRESSSESSFLDCQGPQGSCTPSDVTPLLTPRGFYTENSRFRKGPTAAAGLEFRTRYVTISPELRFSRIISGYPRENRWTGLVGFTFGGRK